MARVASAGLFYLLTGQGHRIDIGWFLTETSPHMWAGLGIATSLRSPSSARAGTCALLQQCMVISVRLSYWLFSSDIQMYELGLVPVRFNGR